MSSAQGAGSDIIKLMDNHVEIDAESTEGNLIPSNEVRGHIKFENIHFRYPTRPGVRVLRGLSLEVEPGTYIALVGASGCGKSTTYVQSARLISLFAYILSILQDSTYRTFLRPACWRSLSRWAQDQRT